MFLRSTELNSLERICIRPGADLVLIYGRRRLGKTTMILRLLEDRKGAYLYTPRGSLVDILNSYLDALNSQLSIDILGKVSRFEEFLDLLYRISKKEKIIIAIDEFQRIQEAARSAISILQDYWDRKLRFTQIKLILVGSLVGIIERLAIHGDAPLFGRLTSQIKIEPLPYSRARIFWKKLDIYDRVLAYGVFGGTPAYMDSYDFSIDIWGNIEILIVRKEGKLNNEPENLLASELRNPLVYMSILERISMGERGLPLGKIHVGESNIIPYIRKLEKMDILKRIYPLNEPRRGALYAFKDEFFRFWFRYIRRYYWLIEMERYDIVLENIKSDINNYLGYTYEEILRELLVLLSGRKINGMKIPTFKKFGPFWERDLEVDALGVSQDTIIVGESKWQDKKLGIREISKILEKAELLAQKFGKKRYIVIILSKTGFRRDYSEENIILLDHEKVEELFDRLTKNTIT